MKNLSVLAFGGAASAVAACSKKVECCSALARSPGLNGRVYYPNSTAYQDRIETYWSINAALEPWCMVLPSNTAETSEVIQVITKHQCPFGIRSGGHAIWTGSSSIHDGVTIDLGHINSTTYDPITKLASLGPGQSWTSVYGTLDPLGVTVTGGRSAQVGVGGFLLGGGNSLHAHAHGLGATNVENFEVVLANGTVVNANKDENPDLWIGLRGGSGNLGLVTRFDMRTIEYADPSNPQIWGGLVEWEVNKTDEILAHFVEFADNIPNDPDSGAFCIWAWGPPYPYPENIIILCPLDNTRNIVAPPVYDKLLGIGDEISNTISSKTMLNRTVEGNGGDDYLYRNVWITGSYQNDPRIMTFLVQRWKVAIQQFKDRIGEENDDGISASLQLHPLTVTMATRGDGPDSLGLKQHFAHQNGTGMQSLLAMTTGKAEHFDLVREIALSYQQDADKYAESLGLNWGWKYLNYADPSENPYSTFGESTLQELREVSEKYDPEGVFQNLRKTGFMIP
ncbi:hypothetical protein GGR57DRAFT_365571 [Xylariaceae sp. FL1272]|nr:hypothetical protein GGR57DRAFT_365571 [Xylariaceae sp. FL1272]